MVEAKSCRITTLQTSDACSYILAGNPQAKRGMIHHCWVVRSPRPLVRYQDLWPTHVFVCTWHSHPCRDNSSAVVSEGKVNAKILEAPCEPEP